MRRRPDPIPRFQNAPRSNPGSRIAVARIAAGVQAPGIEYWTAIIALAALAATSLVGTFGAALFVLAALTLVAANPMRAAQDLVRYSPLLVLPALAIASTLWSAAPSGTLKGALELLLTIMAAIIVYLRTHPRTLLLVLFLCFLGLCLTSLPFVPGALGGRPLAGLFGSKNQLGASAHFLLAFALAVVLDREQHRVGRIAAFCALPFSLGILILTQSATATTGALVTIISFPLLLIFGKVPVSGRAAIFITAAALVAVALFFLPDLANAIADFRQNVLKRNASLTGRTYLWEVAARLSAEKPLLGYGYGSFWRPGNLEAEALWRAGGGGKEQGFNFHNAFVEMKVDLGLVGQSILFAMCAVFATAGLFRHLVRPSVPLACFLSIQVIFYIRSYAENGLIAPFSLMTIIWIMAGVCALSGPRIATVGSASARVPTRRERLPRDVVRV